MTVDLEKLVYDAICDSEDVWSEDGISATSATEYVVRALQPLLTGFLLFMGEDYYPSGGWGDFAGSYPTIEAAQARVAEGLYKYSNGVMRTTDWAHIVAVTTLAPVMVYDNGVWSADEGDLEQQVGQYLIDGGTT